MTRPGPSQNPNGQPRDELDVANRFVQPTTYDELLQLVNLGTGYYEDEDLRLQMRSFRKGLVADLAFHGALWERAVYETKIKMADDGHSYFDPERGEKGTVRGWVAFDELDGDHDYSGSRTKALQERGEEIWNDLARPGETLSKYQAAALQEKTGMQTFKPVFWRLLAAYHESSKSKGARTQDNFFGRVKKQLVEGDDEDVKTLLGRQS